MNFVGSAAKTTNKVEEFSDLPSLTAAVTKQMRSQVATNRQKLLTINISWEQHLPKKVKKNSAETHVGESQMEDYSHETRSEASSGRKHKAEKMSLKSIQMISQENTKHKEPAGQTEKATVRAIPTAESYAVKKSE